jgi:hypothetical protein
MVFATPKGSGVVHWGRLSPSEDDHGRDLVAGRCVPEAEIEVS